MKIAVGALHVAFGHGIAGGAVHAQDLCRSSERFVGYARRPGELDHFVGRRIACSVRASLALAVVVAEISLLQDRLDAASGAECDIDRLARADAIWLAGSAAHDLGVGSAMERLEMAAVVKTRVEFAGGHNRASSICGCGKDGDLAAR